MEATVVDADGNTLPSIVVYKYPEEVSEDVSEETAKMVPIPVSKKGRCRSKQKYRTSWEDDLTFQGWLTCDPTNEYKATCKACGVRFTADITVVKNHAKGIKHLKNLGKYKIERAKPRMRGRPCRVIKKEGADHTNHGADFALPSAAPPPSVNGHCADPSDVAKSTLVEFINELGIDRTNINRMKSLINQCFGYSPEVIEEIEGIPNEGGGMSRHVPLTCRDPFFRDLDRDFFGDRSSPGRQNWFESSPKLFDQHFGGGLWPDETNTGTSSLYLRSRRPPREKSGLSYVNNVKEKFTVILEVPQFLPEELKVRVTGKMLEIEGKHDERSDEHGAVSRHFTRKYPLPDDVMVELIASSLAADGVLTIEAPKKPPEPPRPSEREVPIKKIEKVLV